MRAAVQRNVTSHPKGYQESGPAGFSYPRSKHKVKLDDTGEDLMSFQGSASFLHSSPSDEFISTEGIFRKEKDSSTGTGTGGGGGGVGGGNGDGTTRRIEGEGVKREE
ncbi:hypothetical protein M0804_003922 [Polistes exclamans]|nr:hypothetical protein M0804_003922 [Polistes exclamans]